MADPRFDGQANVKAVKRGNFYCLEKIGFIQGGVSGTTVECYEPDKKFLEFWFTGEGSGDYRGLYLVLALPTAGLDGTAIRGRLVCDAATGNAQGYGGHFTAALSAGGATTSGLFCGARTTLEVENPAAATNITGNGWAALQVDSYVGANATFTGRAAFVRFANVGASVLPYLFNFDGIAAADSGAAIQADSGAVGTVYGYGRVICPDGSVGYIPIYASHS
jgi:hypothetical protein